MSHSFKHTPIIGNAGVSDKKDKQIANRRERSRTRCLLHIALLRGELDCVVLPKKNEISNVYNFSKDGRHWMDIAAKPHLKKYLRK